MKLAYRPQSRSQQDLSWCDFVRTTTPPPGRVDGGAHRHVEVDGVRLQAGMAEGGAEPLQQREAGVHRVGQAIDDQVVVHGVLSSDRPVVADAVAARIVGASEGDGATAFVPVQAERDLRRGLGHDAVTVDPEADRERPGLEVDGHEVDPAGARDALDADPVQRARGVGGRERGPAEGQEQQQEPPRRHPSGLSASSGGR